MENIIIPVILIFWLFLFSFAIFLIYYLLCEIFSKKKIHAIIRVSIYIISILISFFWLFSLTVAFNPALFMIVPNPISYYLLLINNILLLVISIIILFKKQKKINSIIVIHFLLFLISILPFILIFSIAIIFDGWQQD